MEGHRPEIQKVVRSLVVSLAPPGEIYQSYLGEGGGKPSVLRFHMGVKGQNGDLRYTLLGGKLKSSENWREGIQREIIEEAGVSMFGIPKQKIIGQWNYSSEKSGEREVILTYNPVRPANNLVSGDPKIQEIKTLTLAQFQHLVREGHLDGVPIEGHLAMHESRQDTVDTTPEHMSAKDSALAKALSWMVHIDEFFKGKIDKVLFREGHMVSEQEFQVQFAQILSDYMRKGIEVAMPKKATEHHSCEGQDLIEAFNGGYLGKDILYYLPQLARNGADWVGLNQATEGVQVFAGQMKKIFAEFLQEQQLSPQDYKALLINEQVPLARKTSALRMLDQFFRQRLMDIYQVNGQDLNEALNHAQSFLRDLSNEMRVADPKLINGLYQDFTLLNEVHNAHFGYLLSLFLGFDTKENVKEADDLIRFEAGRQLVLLLKSLGGIKHYQEEINKVREGRLQNALNNFFGTAVSEQVVQLDEHNKLRVRIRKRGAQPFIVDEKPVKSFTSYLRKSFEERPENIVDFHTVSVTFADHNQDAGSADILIAEFEQYLRDQYPDASVSLHDKRSYGTNDYLMQSGGRQTIEGKRKGSQGSKFVRTKLLVHLDEEKLELIVYPLYSTQEQNSQFWGWLETRKDDKDYVVRRMLAGENGMPSTYDLFFPPDLYPHHYQHRLGSAYHG